MQIHDDQYFFIEIKAYNGKTENQTRVIIKYTILCPNDILKRPFETRINPTRYV